ncbi:MAG: hypothetical protein M3068_05425 [Gemmatimonadota bacterium]|nr:hypothetical protein [Gemmatimonadota bacterium]
MIGQTEDSPLDPSQRIGLVDRAPDGTSRGITVNSFLLPQANVFNSELNEWFVTVHGDFQRRGPAPLGWFRDPADSNVAWPFDKLNPDGKGQLEPGQYVVLRGTLWQDGGHVPGWFCGNFGGPFCSGQEQAACWNKGDIPPDPPAWPAGRPVSVHGGWLEVHPVDTMYRSTPAGSPPKTTRLVALCAGVDPVDASKTADVKLTPTELTKPPGTVLNFRELIDGRFTDMRTVDEKSAYVTGDTLKVHVKVHSSGTLSFQGKAGRFKAAYILWWAPPPPPLRTMVATMTPSSFVPGTSNVSFTVVAKDAQTGLPSLAQ